MDERTEQLKYKIGNELFMIIYYGVIAAFLIKVLFLGCGLKDCITEYAIMIFVPIYHYIRSRQLEVSFFGSGNRARNKTLITSAILAVIGTIYVIQINGRNGHSTVSAESIIGFITFIAVFVIIRFIMYRAEKNRRDKLENKYM